MGNKESINKRLTEPILTTYETLEDLQEALVKAGLESSNLVVGIDFTGSNAESGKRTYGRNLHTIDPSNPNPYMKVMDIMGRALERFDDDGLIPVFGFGDKTTHDHSVFDLNPEKKPFVGMQPALEQYKKTVPGLTLSGPTSFVPLIDKTIEIVKQTKQYHILIIICDGQVSNVDKNRRAIEEASKYPISIVCVGVGDGPFGVMENFDDVIKNSKFDNFNFIDYYKKQYAFIKHLGYLDN
ncbi:Copine [Entamoeba marina]